MAKGFSDLVQKVNRRMRTMAKSNIRPKEYDTCQSMLKGLPTSQRTYNRKTKQYEFSARRIKDETISILRQMESIGTQTDYLKSIQELQKQVGSDVSLKSLQQGISASTTQLIDDIGSEIFRLALEKSMDDDDTSHENMLKNVGYYQNKEYTNEEEERLISMNYLDF